MLADAEDDDPSAADVEVVLLEMLQKSREPEFRNRIREVLAATPKARANPRTFRAALTLEIQAPLLERLGLPPNADGQDRLRHVLQRRIVEGNLRLQILALDLQELLEIDDLPDLETEAEEFLASKVGDTSMRCSDGALDRACRNRISQEQCAGALSTICAERLQQWLDSGCMSTPSIMSLLVMAKIGLSTDVLSGGGCGAPDVNEVLAVPVLMTPTAEDFFQTFVLPGRPAVLCGCFSESEAFPPLTHFPDFAHLRARCGHRRVPVKSIAHDDREGRPVFVSDPGLRLPLGALLGAIETHEREGMRMPFYLGKVPLRAELPELAKEIDDAPTCPQRLYGECFGELKPEGVYTYLGCGRNTTPVHFDAHENLCLCLCGSKRVWCYPPSDARYLYPVNDFTRSAVVPFIRNLGELTEELQETYAHSALAHPVEVMLSAGDMLYLPSCWWHCFEGSQDRNMILNWWFDLHPEKRALAALGDVTQ